MNHCVKTDSGMDVLLVFPSVTEANLFPYASVPALTGYLRQRGRSVFGADLNLGLAHGLFCGAMFARLRERLAGGSSLSQRYRHAQADYLSEHADAIARRVFGKDGASDADVRAVKTGIELFYEDCLLTRKCLRLAEIVEHAGAALDPQDIATHEARDQLVALLDEHRPRLVAISVAYYSQLLPTLLMCRWIREHAPDTRIVVGGQQLMLHGEDLLRIDGFRTLVDHVGVGAGEATLAELCEVADGRREPDDVSDAWWTGSPKPHALSKRPPQRGIHFRDLPTPDFSDLPLTRYVSSYVELGVTTCVGCFWGRCTFCSYGNRSFKSKGYQQASAEQIARDCETLVKRHGITRINFVDENTNLRLVLQAMRKLNARGIRINFSTRNRLEPVLLRRELCQELADRGCVLMSCGYDTNVQRLLDAVNKGVRSEHYQQIIDNVHEAGITLRFSVMGGLPGETEADARQSEAFLRENQDKIGIDIMQLLVLEKGTLLHDDPAAHGLEIVEDDTLRGNERLNYGMGRMGPAFGYQRGPQFEAREADFAGSYDRVLPQKNTDVSPERRTQARATAPVDPDAIELALHPWIRLLEGDDAPVLADLQWQRFLRLPGATVRAGRLCFPLLAPDRAARVVAQLAARELGVPTVPPSISNLAPATACAFGEASP